VSATPVTFEADYVESRSRLTTFFRALLAIPHLIVVALYSIAAEICVVIAWFALVLTGRWPRGLYDFVAGFLRYATSVYGYLFLLADPFPPFGAGEHEYPVRLVIGPPKPEYSRLKALLRIFLAIPPAIITYAMGIVAQLGAVLAWFAIVILGRQPRGLQDMIVLGLSYQQRAYAYFFLLTEDWPAFTTPQQETVAPTFEPPQPPEPPDLAA
jgi:Domain of unknown function (DUF4389)